MVRPCDTSKGLEKDLRTTDKKANQHSWVVNETKDYNPILEEKYIILTRIRMQAFFK